MEYRLKVMIGSVILHIHLNIIEINCNLYLNILRKYFYKFNIVIIYEEFLVDINKDDDHCILQSAYLKRNYITNNLLYFAKFVEALLSV